MRPTWKIKLCESSVVFGVASIFWGWTILDALRARLAYAPLTLIIGGLFAALAAGSLAARFASYGCTGTTSALRRGCLVGAAGNLALLLVATRAPSLAPAVPPVICLVADVIALAASTGLSRLPGWSHALVRVGALAGALFGTTGSLAANLVCVYAPACSMTDMGAHPGAVTLVEQRYGGYNIVEEYARYFGVLQLDGPFDYARFVSGGYQDQVAGGSRAAVEDEIAARLGRRPAPGEDAVTPRLTLADYQGYNVFVWQGNYFGLPVSQGTFEVDRYHAVGYAGLISAKSQSDVVGAILTDKPQRVAPGEFAFIEGFFPSEGPEGEALPRWGGAQSTMAIYPGNAEPVTLDMQVVQPQMDGRSQPDLSVIVDGVPVPPSNWQILSVDGGRYRVWIQLGTDTLPTGAHRVHFYSPVFVPAEVDSRSLDHRVLGFRIEDMSVRTGSVELRLASAGA